ncbi:hypothetical protein [Fibrobacter succinogenes]|uniref:hypothetical protein n=1 Tax=Fibrobacter succinogenes TaxID=833 RepID=UPI00156637DB|nr:hypothetical protein [Fibrobacter succinogenes]
MKKILVIVLLFLTTSAFCDDHAYYIMGGYSQTLTGTTPVGDLSIGVHYTPQAVSDESLFQLPFTLLAIPFAVFLGDDDCSSRCGLDQMALYVRIIGVVGFILHGSLYFPVVPNSYFGIINKHRLVTEIITKGWHKESFTFQDDIGLRLQIQPEGYFGFFIDGGFRFEKNFSRDFEKKWFVQAALLI